MIESVDHSETFFDDVAYCDELLGWDYWRGGTCC